MRDDCRDGQSGGTQSQFLWNCLDDLTVMISPCLSNNLLFQKKTSFDLFYIGFDYQKTQI